MIPNIELYEETLSVPITKNLKLVFNCCFANPLDLAMNKLESLFLKGFYIYYGKGAFPVAFNFVGVRRPH